MDGHGMRSSISKTGKRQPSRTQVASLRAVVALACEELEQGEVHKVLGTVTLDELIELQLKELVGPLPSDVGYQSRKDSLVTLKRRLEEAVAALKTVDPDDLQMVKETPGAGPQGTVPVQR